MDINKKVKQRIISQFVPFIIDNKKAVSYLNSKEERQIKEWIYFIYIFYYEPEYIPILEDLDEFKTELHKIIKYFSTNG